MHPALPSNEHLWFRILHMVSHNVIFLTFYHGDVSVPSLPSQIMSHAAESPEGTLLCPSALLHLGSRAAVDQALSRLARKGKLMRVCQGVYARPIQTRFGPRPPAVDKVLASLSALWGETIVPCGGAAANALGLIRASTSAGAGTAGSPDIRTQPQAQARWASGGTAPCPTVATGGAPPASRRRCPRPSLARS